MERIREERALINAPGKKRKNGLGAPWKETHYYRNGSKENEGKADKSKTKTDDAVLDADRCIWKASRRGPSARRVATSAIRSFLGSIEWKKNQQNGTLIHKELIDGERKTEHHCKTLGSVFN